MRIRYYVLRDGDRYRLLRESKHQGFHDTMPDANESAVFMASIEAGRLQTVVEIFAEDEGGRLMLDRIVHPDDQVCVSPFGKPKVLRVGREEVLLASA